jgi:hypothetical protein
VLQTLFKIIRPELGKKYPTGKNAFYKNGLKCDQLFPTISAKICKKSSFSFIQQGKEKGNKNLFGPF